MSERIEKLREEYELQLDQAKAYAAAKTAYKAAFDAAFDAADGYAAEVVGAAFNAAIGAADAKRLWREAKAAPEAADEGHYYPD